MPELLGRYAAGIPSFEWQRAKFAAEAKTELAMRPFRASGASRPIRAAGRRSIALGEIMRPQQLEECVFECRARIRGPLATVNPTLSECEAELARAFSAASASVEAKNTWSSAHCMPTRLARPTP
jgi:hypothetical protein